MSQHLTLEMPKHFIICMIKKRLDYFIRRSESVRSFLKKSKVIKSKMQPKTMVILSYTKIY